MGGQGGDDPVRLRRGNRNRRTVMTGIAPGKRLASRGTAAGAVAHPAAPGQAAASPRPRRSGAAYRHAGAPLQQQGRREREQKYGHPDQKELWRVKSPHGLSNLSIPITLQCTRGQRK